MLQKAQNKHHINSPQHAPPQRRGGVLLPSPCSGLTLSPCPALAATTSSTVRLARAVHDMDLTPNKKSLVLGKKWREERNFWIAALTFMLWWWVPETFLLAWDLCAGVL